MSSPTDPPGDRPVSDQPSGGGVPPPPPAQDYPGQQYGEQQYGEQQYGEQAQYAQQPYGAPQQQQGNGLAVAGLVLGILGVLFAFIPLLGVVAGVFFGLLAAVFGGLGLSKAKQGRGGKGMAIAGLVLGIIAIILGVLQGTLLGAIGEAVSNDPVIQQELDELGEQLEEFGTS